MGVLWDGNVREQGRVEATAHGPHSTNPLGASCWGAAIWLAIEPGLSVPKGSLSVHLFSAGKG